jgi:hypothetical protein
MKTMHCTTQNTMYYICKFVDIAKCYKIEGITSSSSSEVIFKDNCKII